MTVIPNKDGTWDPATKDRPGWKKVMAAEDGAAYQNSTGIVVIISGEIHDCKAWIHVSLSRKGRMPTYEDIALVKRAFIGDDEKAIMVLPDKAHHVNLHPYCLHLFNCIDGDGLPEFSAIVAGTRTI